MRLKKVLFPVFTEFLQKNVLQLAEKSVLRKRGVP